MTDTDRTKRTIPLEPASGTEEIDINYKIAELYALLFAVRDRAIRQMLSKLLAGIAIVILLVVLIGSFPPLQFHVAGHFIKACDLMPMYWNAWGQLALEVSIVLCLGGAVFSEQWHSRIREIMNAEILKSEMRIATMEQNKKQQIADLAGKCVNAMRNKKMNRG